MRSGYFAVGVVAGLAGAAAAAVAMNQMLVGTDMGNTVSRTAHRAAGAVSQAAHETADTVDRIVH